MAFERTLRRWVRDLGLFSAAFPIDSRRAEGDIRVGHTLRLYARPRGSASRVHADETLNAPAVRLRTLGRFLASREARLAHHHRAISERPSAKDSSSVRGPDLGATLAVRFRAECVVPAVATGPDHAGEPGQRLRALGAFEQP